MYNNVSIFKYINDVEIIPDVSVLFDAESEINKKLNGFQITDLFAHDTIKVGLINHLDNSYKAIHTREPSKDGDRDYVTFSICVSQKRINAKQVEFLMAKSANISTLSKEDKAELKRTCKESLIEKTIPSSNIFNVTIDYSRKNIYLEGKHKFAIEFMHKILNEVFGIDGAVQLDFFDNGTNFLDLLLQSANESNELSSILINEFSTNKTIKFNEIDLSNKDDIDNIINNLSGYSVKQLKINLKGELEFGINDKYYLSSIKESSIDDENDTEIDVFGNLWLAIYNVTKIFDYIKEEIE